MEGLYKKVIKGHHSKIPSRVSMDLANIIKMMLEAHPEHRPTCGKDNFHNIIKLNFK